MGNRRKLHTVRVNVGCDSPDWRLGLPSLRPMDEALGPCVYPARPQIALALALVARSVGGESETYQGSRQVGLGQYFIKYHLKTIFNFKGTEIFWR